MDEAKPVEYVVESLDSCLEQTEVARVIQVKHYSTICEVQEPLGYWEMLSQRIESVFVVPLSRQRLACLENMRRLNSIENRGDRGALGRDVR